MTTDSQAFSFCAWLLTEKHGHVRRRYEDRTRKLRELGRPAEPTVALILDCRGGAGEQVAKLYMDESYFQEWRATASREGVPVVTVSMGVPEAVALVRQFCPDAEDGIRQPPPPGTFTTAVIAENRTLVAHLPIEGESRGTRPLPLRPKRLTSFLSPQADHSTSA